MKKIIININENLVQEILPIMLLQMKYLSENESLAKLEALNKLSPVLDEIFMIQKSLAKRIEDFIATNDPVIINEEAMALAEDYKIISHFDLSSLELPERICWTTLFLGEIARRATDQETDIEAVAVNYAGFCKFSQLIAFDEELTEYFTAIGEHTIDLLEEANNNIRGERPNLAEQTDVFIEVARELYNLGL